MAGVAEKLDGDRPAAKASGSQAVAFSFSATRCCWCLGRRGNCRRQILKTVKLKPAGGGAARPGASVRLPCGPGAGVSAPPPHPTSSRLRASQRPPTHAAGSRHADPGTGTSAAQAQSHLPSRFPRQPNQPVSSPLCLTPSASAPSLPSSPHRHATRAARPPSPRRARRGGKRHPIPNRSPRLRA
jgi:hypothetical protein